ncbi:MAG: hypothetical protein M3342_15755, partial [Bacteroidota bacterium]|nr:hypothetical protein [Bacteroidota bacterium]
NLKMPKAAGRRLCYRTFMLNRRMRRRSGNKEASGQLIRTLRMAGEVIRTFIACSLAFVLTVIPLDVLCVNLNCVQHKAGKGDTAGT